MTPLKRDFINSKVKDLLEAGIISKLVEGSNICAYPVVVVAHPQTKKLRMCIDFVELNKVTEDFTFPLPNIKEILNRLANKKIYAKLDLSQGFHQLRIHEDSKKYLVFITQDGLYKWERLPFGPKQGPGLFQQVMFIILDELRGIVCEIYLDDIIIYGVTIEQYIENLIKVFTRLRKFNVRLELTKCLFNLSEIEYLGYIVNKKGFRLADSRLEPIRTF